MNPTCLFSCLTIRLAIVDWGQFARPKSKVISLCSLLFILAGTVNAQTENSEDRLLQPKIVTTIKPLQLIVDAVVGDIGSTHALLSANQSPHHLSISPQNRLNLETADLIVWVGPQLEHFLEPVISQAAQDQQVITFTEISGLQLLSMGGNTAIGIDPHLWLSTLNATKLAEEVVRQLSKIDRDNAAQYNANLKSFLDSIAVLRENTQELLSEFKASNLDYVVYHNALQYFEAENGINHVLALTDDPEQPPGIREIISKRQALKELSPSCALLDIEANESLVDTLFSELPLDERPLKIRVDLMGVNSGDELITNYQSLMRRLASSFNYCISQP